MSINLGNTLINKAYLGIEQVYRIYLGAKLFFYTLFDFSDFDVAVNSNKWVVGEDGLLTEIVAGDLPYTFTNGYPQLLVEPERTNLCRYSGFDNWGSQQLLTFNAAISPSGAMDAVLFSHDGGVYPQTAISCNYVEGTLYTASIWVKSDGTPQVQHSLISNGTLTGKVDFTPTSEWQLISVTGVSVDSIGALVVAQNSGSSIPASFYMWHAQLEEGPNTTSIIPTNGVEVTRLADEITKTPPMGTTLIKETINGVDNEIITIPALYQVPDGLIDKVIFS